MLLIASVECLLSVWDTGEVSLFLEVPQLLVEFVQIKHFALEVSNF